MGRLPRLFRSFPSAEREMGSAADAAVETESGEEVQRCDLKCGIQTLNEYHAAYLAPPIRMKGPKWISVAFVGETDPELVFRLFDRAMISGDEQGFTLVLEQPPQPEIRIHRDTPLSLPPRPVRELEEDGLSAVNSSTRSRPMWNTP